MQFHAVSLTPTLSDSISFLFLNVFAFAVPASYISCQSPPLFKLKALLITFISISRAEQNMRIRVFLLPSSMPLTVHLCLLVTSALLLFLCSTRSCLGTPYEKCLSEHCGGVEFRYPFGKTGSGCGDPHFQFVCDSDDLDALPRLNINGNSYIILMVDNGQKIMKIVHDSIWSSKENICNFPVNKNQSFWQDSPIFQLANRYTIVTFWECTSNVQSSVLKMINLLGCPVYWYYSWGAGLNSQGTSICKTHFQIPFQKYPSGQPNPTLLSEGFEITWHDELSKRCDVCMGTKGSCGYHLSEPDSFLCYCPNGASYTGGKCRGNGGSNKAIIIGCSIGGAALTTLALLLFWMFYRKRKQPPPPPRACNSVSKVEKFLKEYAYEMPTRYSQSDLKKMTSNFAAKLGEGGYGVVYKGKLQNGALVAVKLLDRHRHSENQFMNEVATIGRVHHVNLVRLLGYCFESFTSALVYEFMANGSLEKSLFARKEKEQILSWEQLRSIALGAARGIAYLHEDCEKRIVHFDIKPHNILLDSEFTPKVADFGLAKLCAKGDDHISMTGARGTPGYVAPEVWSGDLGPVTDKSDVYSFGMLLLEIIGGRKNFDVQVSRSSQLYFPEWAFKLLESGKLGMRLRGGRAMEVEDEEKARRLTKIGLWCVQYNYRDRPCMSRVVQMLEGNGDDVTSPPLPFNSSAEPVNPLASSTLTSSIEIRL